MDDVFEVLTAPITIALIMDARIVSKTSVNIYDSTKRNIREDKNLHTRCLKNLKSHVLIMYLDM
jgi:hypothetical protein